MSVHSLHTSSSSCVKNIHPHPFQIQKRHGNHYYKGPITIITANIGMLPAAILGLQQFGSLFTNQPTLSLPSHRVSQIAKKLAHENTPIICCQEAFDVESAKYLSNELSKKGYTVLYSGGTGDIVDSGLLFATRYSIQKSEVKFWKFTNLSQADAFSSKGVLRVPLKVILPDGRKLKLVVYTTHLQAQTGHAEINIRTEQVNMLLSTIQTDYLQDPEQIILLAGDLNISDIECGQQWHGEYTQKTVFFSHFYDLVNSGYHHIDGKRQPHTFGSYRNEPQGTFYDLANGKVETGCFYDRILLYKGNGTISFDFTVTILRTMEGGLSDHLPVVATLHGL